MVLIQKQSGEIRKKFSLILCRVMISRNSRNKEREAEPEWAGSEELLIICHHITANSFSPPG
jgi:hypothetical protein